MALGASFPFRFIGALMIAITVVVVAVPEGLPLGVSISLAYSVRQMAHEKSFVRYI